MHISLEQTRKIAKLARIKVSEEELLRHQEELEKILGWIDKLQQVDVSGVEPLLSVYDGFQRMYQDNPEEQHNEDALMKCAPASKLNYFCSPKVVE